MNKKTLLLIAVVVMAIVSCKKEDTGNTTLDTGTIILEKLVDANGATLTSGAFTVVIPQNAITTATTITLSKSTEKPFGTSQKSDIYFVNNLPETLLAPVTLSIGGFSVSDDVKTFFAESGYALSLGEETAGYRFVDHNFADGQLHVTLKPGSSVKSANVEEAGTNQMSIGILAAGGQGTFTSAEGHFRITYPVTDEPGAQELGPYLEEAYAKFLNSPFSFSYANRTAWPVEVTVKQLKSSIFGYCGASVWGNNSNYLQFNFDKLSDKVEMRITAGHEFMHFVQYLYDPRSRFSKKTTEPDQFWLDEAQAVWVESLFTSKANYLSSVRSGNENSPFSAVRKSKADGAQGYGYGMSAMIKYLTARQGNDVIRKINEKIQAGEKPAEAVRQATGKSYYEWYGNFIDQYTLGKVYTDVSINLLVGIKTDEFAIKTAKDSVKEYASAYGQLQSKINITTLTADAFTDISSLDFTIKNPTNTEMINVYKFNNNTIENIGQNLVTVRVPNIKTLAQGGYKIMTVVTNENYDYTSDASQNISWSTRIVESNSFKQVQFGLGVMCYNKTTRSDGTSETGVADYYMGFPKMACTQTGNVITATWEALDYNGIYPHTGTATFTLESNKTVTFTITDKGTGSDGFTRTSSATGSAVPITHDAWDGQYYEVTKSHTVLKTATFTLSHKNGYHQETTGIITDPNYINLGLGFYFYY